VGMAISLMQIVVGQMRMEIDASGHVPVLQQNRATQYQVVRHQRGRIHRPAVVLLVVSGRSPVGFPAHTLYSGHRAAILMSSGLPGRWDRNRTGTLRS
jgi:hypothetical protein